MENSQSANDHGDEGKVEDKQRDDKSKQVNGEVADDEEEDESVDVLCGDDGAQPLHACPRCPVNQVLLHLNNDMQRILEQLMRSITGTFRTHELKCGGHFKIKLITPLSVISCPWPF